MLVMKSLKLRGEVITPSFTFCATTNAIEWCGMKPVFADIEEGYLCADPNHVNELVTKKTSAILATHVFGNPCDIGALQDIADDRKIRLFFDAAHCFGSEYKGKKIGNFGDAESFSLSPTKLVVAVEGGFLTTNDDEIARLGIMGRDYGHDGSYDCEFAGLNARMEEFNAIIGNETLKRLEKNLQMRTDLVGIYRQGLSKVPGISFQKIRDRSRTTYKDFPLILDEKEFGLSRDQLYESLRMENIISKKYFDPPSHKQRAFRQDIRLPVTDSIAPRIISIPLFSHMPKDDVKKVIETIKNIHENAEDIRKAL